MTTRLMVIALDSVENSLLEAMIDRGQLPNLERIRTRSSVAKIENHYPFGAGVFWPSIATGVGPDEHGRYYSRRFDSRRLKVVKFRDDQDFRVGPLWATLDEEGMKGVVIDWPHAPRFAPKEGIVVDEWFPHDTQGDTFVHPGERFSDFVQKYGRDPFGGRTWGTDVSTPAAVESFMDKITGRIRQKCKMGLELLEEQEWDYFLLGFADAHDVGHLCWHLHDPEHDLFDPVLAQAQPDPVEACYIELDRSVGRLEAALPDDVSLLVIGGPGMRSFRSINPYMKKICQQLQTAENPVLSERGGDLYARSLSKDIRKALRPFARLGRQALERNEYRKMKFWSVDHNAHAGAVRISVKGRERNGLVAMGCEYDDLCDKIEEKFRSIVNLETGLPIVRDVFRVRKHMNGKHIDDLPDLFILWNTEDPIKKIGSPDFGEMEIARHQRSGDHTSYGFMYDRDGLVPPLATLLPADVCAVIRERTYGVEGAMRTSA